MSKITYGIKCCIRYEDRLNACLETWAKDEDVLLSTDLVEQDLVEKYDSLTRKTKRLFATTTFTPGNWFMYADDDTYVNTDALGLFCEHLDSSKITVIGKGCMPCPAKTKKFVSSEANAIKMKNVPKHTLFQGGAGTLLSYSACIMIQTMIWAGRAPETDLYLAEDQWLTATIGSYTHLMSTYLGNKKTVQWGGRGLIMNPGELPIEERFQTTQKNNKGWEQAIENVATGKAYTLHHVLPDDMRLIHARYNAFCMGNPD